MKRIEDLLKESGITGGIPLDYCPVKLKKKQSKSVGFGGRRHDCTDRLAAAGRRRDFDHRHL